MGKVPKGVELLTSSPTFSLAASSFRFREIPLFSLATLSDLSFRFQDNAFKILSLLGLDSEHIQHQPHLLPIEMRPHEMNEFLMYCILFLFVMLILSIILLFVSRPIYKLKCKHFPGEQDYEVLV